MTCCKKDLQKILHKLKTASENLGLNLNAQETKINR